MKEQEGEWTPFNIKFLRFYQKAGKLHKLRSLSKPQILKGQK
jgi:hypothetical protein